MARRRFLVTHTAGHHSSDWLYNHYDPHTQEYRRPPLGLADNRLLCGRTDGDLCPALYLCADGMELVYNVGWRCHTDVLDSATSYSRFLGSFFF